MGSVISKKEEKILEIKCTIEACNLLLKVIDDIISSPSKSLTLDNSDILKTELNILLNLRNDLVLYKIELSENLNKVFNE
jgi:hypothetical protein